jgi:hypothetical protein
MEASCAGKREHGAKEDESSTGRVWTAGFHQVTARSRLERVLKIMSPLFLEFSNFFSGRGELLITETEDTVSADTWARLY